MWSPGTHTLASGSGVGGKSEGRSEGLPARHSRSAGVSGREGADGSRRAQRNNEKVLAAIYFLTTLKLSRALVNPASPPSLYPVQAPLYLPRKSPPSFLVLSGDMPMLCREGTPITSGDVRGASGLSGVMPELKDVACARPGGLEQEFEWKPKI